MASKLTFPHGERERGRERTILQKGHCNHK